jgi:hypothetical protein
MWLAFGTFVVACLVFAFTAYLKGDVRAGCETRFGRFFVEANERSATREEEHKKVLK